MRNHRNFSSVSLSKAGQPAYNWPVKDAQPSEANSVSADVAALRRALQDDLDQVDPAPDGGALVALCGLPGTGKGYAWSKSNREIPRFLRIRWRVPAAKSRFPCLGTGDRRPFAGFSQTS